MSARQNLEIFNLYESEWQPWRNKAIKYNNFYKNKQYSKKAQSDLKSMGLKALVINVVRPLLGQQLSILTSTKPTWRIVPLQGASKEVADIAGRFLVGKWNSDYLDTQLELALLDVLKVGLGYLFVDCASFLDNATFDILIERVNWKFVYPDPLATKFDLSDAENIIIKKRIGAKRAQVQFQLTDAELKDAISTAGGVNPQLVQVDVIDRFSKYPVERVSYDVNEKYRNELRDLPPKIFYTSKLKGIKEQEKRNYYKELKQLETDGKIDITKMNELNIHRCLSAGQADIFEGIMNIRDYPVITFSNEFSENANDVDGETVFLEGIQEALNKFYMLTIHNAMLTGNVRYTAPEGSITNPEQWQKASMIPGAVSFWKPQPDLPNAGQPVQIQPGQLSSAFYGLSNDLMRKAEYETSVFAPIQGNPQGSPETFSTTATLQDFGSQRIKRLARKVDIMIAKAGEVVLQYIQNYTDTDELLEYIDDRPFTEEGQINPAFGTNVSVGKVNTPVVNNEAVVKEIKNDTRIGKYAVKVLTQPNLGTDRLIKANFLTSLTMNKVLPFTPAVSKKLLDLMEIPGYMEIVAELSQNSDMQGKVQQLVQNIQVLQKQLQHSTGEADKLAKKLEISDFRNSLDKELLRIKEQVMSHRQNLQSQVDDMVAQQEQQLQGNGQQ